MPYVSQGLGCACGGTCGACKDGLGDLLDPSTWGWTEWLIAAGTVFVGVKLFKSEKKYRYTRAVRRRLGAE